MPLRDHLARNGDRRSAAAHISPQLIPRTTAHGHDHPQRQSTRNAVRAGDASRWRSASPTCAARRTTISTRCGREAAKIVQQAHQQAEQIRRQAEVAGRKAAEAAIERILDEKVGKRMDTLLPALEQLVREINDTKGELLSHWEQSALKVSTAIAERIIRRELAHEPQITLDLIAEALRLATGTAEITLHMNPTDYENLGSQINRLAETLCQLAPSEIVADPRHHRPAVAASKRSLAKSISRSNRSCSELKKSSTLTLRSTMWQLSAWKPHLLDNLNSTMTASLDGSVVETIGMTAAVADFPAPVGAVVRIERDGDTGCEGEVVGFRDGHTLVYLLTPTTGVRRGNRVRFVRTTRSLQVGPALLGRVIDARGRLHRRPAAAAAYRTARGSIACRRRRPSGRGFASRWPPACTRSTRCSRAAAASGSGFSPAPASARACSWA